MTRRRLVAGLAVAVVLLGGGLCASVYAVGLRLSAPAPAVVGAPPPELAGAEPVVFPSPSGSLLHGWWVPASSPGARAGMVLMHGVRANRLEMVARARVLREHGFSVLLFDLQAHGESPGRRITFGKLEALDAATAVRFVRERLPAGRVGVVGVSLGGAAALLGPAPPAVDALVLESVYPDIDAALANRLRSNLGPVLGAVFTPILTPAFEVLLPPVLGVSPADLRPLDRIGTAGVPVLVASGTQDAYTPIGEAEALFARATEPKQFWAVEGAGHVDLEQFDPAAYWRVVLPFLDRYLQDQPGTQRPSPAP